MPPIIPFAAPKLSVSNFLSALAENPRLYAKATGLSQNLAEKESLSIRVAARAGRD